MQLDLYVIPYIRINSEQNRSKCQRKKPIKLLEETDVSLRDFRLGNGFLDMTPKAEATKATKFIYYVEFIKTFVLH